ncbi:MAG: hypothetical protein HQL41_12160 [Alphaproteobacteria bacterium]|nr:hypothetical protein [Alphaproteobacteria bacterium]
MRNTKDTKDTKGAAIRPYSPGFLVTLGGLGALVVNLFSELSSMAGQF